jgi:hypothetical protein
VRRQRSLDLRRHATLRPLFHHSRRRGLRVGWWTPPRSQRTRGVPLAGSRRQQQRPCIASTAPATVRKRVPAAQCAADAPVKELAITRRKVATSHERTRRHTEAAPSGRVSTVGDGRRLLRRWPPNGPARSAADAPLPLIVYRPGAQPGI